MVSGVWYFTRERRLRRPLHFAALEDVVFFLQGAVRATEAANEEDRYANRYDQRNQASTDKNPMHPALHHRRYFTRIKGYSRQVFVSLGDSNR